MLKVVAHSGKEIMVDVDTIAAHGDSPIAIELARALVKALKSEGVELAPAGSFV